MMPRLGTAATLLSLLLATACAAPRTSDTITRAAAQPGPQAPLPVMKRFTGSRPTPPTTANADIARDFLDLSFALEDGRALPVLTRFEGPITLRVTGAPAPTLDHDLDQLLARLRDEAGISIRRTDRPGASITVEAITRNDINTYVPRAACFVAPNVGSLMEYRLTRRTSRVRWSRMQERRRIAVFVPADASPQELRDCLHEELAQALGPLNDLYRLPDSVFNDDNMHTVLTGYDMLILRLYYDPALASGQSRAEVAAHLPARLAALNPAGEDLPPRPLAPAPRDWIAATETSIALTSMPAERYRAAVRALDIARAQGWTDHRRAFSHYILGTQLQVVAPEAARDHFLAANHYYGDRADTALHRAYVAAQLATGALDRDRPREALSLVRPQFAVARRHENAALLSTLMLLQAEALARTGRPVRARQVRLDSLGWARYGFGPDWAVHAKAREIAALSPARSF